VNSPHIDGVRRIFADVFQLPLEQIAPHSSPETIPAWDSLQHLNLVLALEEEYHVQFTPEEIERMLSVEIAAEILNGKCVASKVA
jgi:acyl carrier protein